MNISWILEAFWNMKYVYEKSLQNETTSYELYSKWFISFAKIHPVKTFPWISPPIQNCQKIFIIKWSVKNQQFEWIVDLPNYSDHSNQSQYHFRREQTDIKDWLGKSPYWFIVQVYIIYFKNSLQTYMW